MATKIKKCFICLSRKILILIPLSTDTQSPEWLLSAVGGKRPFPLFHEAVVYKLITYYHQQNFLYYPINRIAADLDAKPGNKYTGNIKSPSENIYSLVLNGVTYWSIDTSVSGQLTIQVLPNTLKNLIVPSKTTDHYVEIRYALRLDDATAWNERTLEEKTYTNRITQSTALS